MEECFLHTSASSTQVLSNSPASPPHLAAALAGHMMLFSELQMYVAPAGEEEKPSFKRARTKLRAKVLSVLPAQIIRLHAPRCIWQLCRLAEQAPTAVQMYT